MSELDPDLNPDLVDVTDEKLHNTDCPHGELPRTCYVCDLEAERDRLRAAFEGVQALLDERTDRWALAIAERDTAEAERDQLRADNDEYDQLLTRLRDLLTGTANALKGEPEPLHMHDWSDLPKVAAAVATERNRLRAEAVLGRVLARSLGEYAATEGMGWWVRDRVLGVTCEGHDVGLETQVDEVEESAIRRVFDAKGAT